MMNTSEVEVVVKQAWQSVVGVEHVSAEDNFFASGGDSVSAIDLMAHVESALRIEFPLETLLVDGHFGSLVEECAARAGAEKS